MVYYIIYPCDQTISFEGNDPTQYCFKPSQAKVFESKDDLRQYVKELFYSNPVEDQDYVIGQCESIEQLRNNPDDFDWNTGNVWSESL